MALITDIPRKKGLHLFQFLKQSQPNRISACVGELGFVKQHSIANAHAFPCVHNRDIATRTSKLLLHRNAKNGDYSERRKPDFILSYARFHLHAFPVGVQIVITEVIDRELKRLHDAMIKDIMLIVVLQGRETGAILATMGRHKEVDASL